MYKNFKLTEEEKSQILEMHQSHGYKKPLNEQREKPLKNKMEINEMFGFNYLVKMKIDLSVDISDEEKQRISQKIARGWNGHVAIEFNDGEWYGKDGKIDDIDSYEEYVNNVIFKDRKGDGWDKWKDSLKQNQRNTPMDDKYDYRYDDEYLKEQSDEGKSGVVKIDGLKGELVLPFNNILKREGFKVIEKRDGGSPYSLIFDNEVVLDLSIENSNVILKVSKFGDDNILRNHIGKPYTFELGGNNIVFEFGLLKDFLKRVGNIILKEKSKRDFK